MQLSESKRDFRLRSGLQGEIRGTDIAVLIKVHSAGLLTEAIRVLGRQELHMDLCHGIQSVAGMIDVHHYHRIIGLGESGPEIGHTSLDGKPFFSELGRDVNFDWHLWLDPRAGLAGLGRLPTAGALATGVALPLPSLG